MSAAPRRAPPGSARMLDDSHWSHKAWMSQVDADLFERTLLNKSRAAEGALQILEWGTGRSTLYFTELLTKLGRPFHWLSLDYNRDYIKNEIAPQLAGNPAARLIHAGGSVPTPSEGASLEVVVFDKGRLQPFLDGHERDRLADLDDYVGYPSQPGRRFDFIFVDGRKRRRCLIEAARLLKDDGLVLLHDAYRRHYQCAFQHYRSQRMLGEVLWIGSQADTDFLEWIL